MEPTQRKAVRRRGRRACLILELLGLCQYKDSELDLALSVK
jgi:hypothetical protein